MRSVLALRSKVFERMLCGDFAKWKDSVVSLSYDGKTVEKVVKYCRGTQIKLFEAEAAEERGEEIVSLVAASDFFLLDELGDIAVERAGQEMDGAVEVACAVYEEASSAGLEGHGIPSCALEKVRDAVKCTLLRLDGSRQTPWLLSMSGDLLVSVLNSDLMTATSLVSVPEGGEFNLILSWMGADSEYVAQDENRLEKAKEAASHIELHAIPPLRLAADIESSQLVTTEQLMNAYKRQAVMREKVDTCGIPNLDTSDLYFLGQAFPGLFPPDPSIQQLQW